MAKEEYVKVCSVAEQAADIDDVMSEANDTGNRLQIVNRG
jgi:hypothetical protein